jgi:hypothetical protein
MHLSSESLSANRTVSTLTHMQAVHTEGQVVSLAKELVQHEQQVSTHCHHVQRT